MVRRFDGETVLLSGATGFTGRYVQEGLEQLGCRVVDPEADGRGFDLRKIDDVRRVVRREPLDYVIHLAARSFVAEMDSAAFYAINTVGTSNLLAELADSGQPLKKVVVASSANVYGNALASPIGETCPPAPVNHYACSKLAMEHMAATFRERLPIVITRPFNYTGVGQAGHFLIPKLVAHYARREPSISLGNIDVERDFSDVRAVAAAYIRLLASDIAGETLNICSGIGRSLRSVMQALHEITGHSIQISVDPALVRKSEVTRLVGDPARLRDAVGPLGFDDFRETLVWMVSVAERQARP